MSYDSLCGCIGLCWAQAKLSTITHYLIWMLTVIFYRWTLHRPATPAPIYKAFFKPSLCSAISNSVGFKSKIDRSWCIIVPSVLWKCRAPFKSQHSQLFFKKLSLYVHITLLSNLLSKLKPNCQGFQLCFIPLLELQSQDAGLAITFTRIHLPQMINYDIT